MQLGVKCCTVTHTLSRSLPTASIEKLDGPLPLQISWRSASLLLVHSVGLEPANKRKIPGKSFRAILHLPCPASSSCLLIVLDNSNPSCNSIYSNNKLTENSSATGLCLYLFLGPFKTFLPVVNVGHQQRSMAHGMALGKNDTLISELLLKTPCRTSCHYCEQVLQKTKSKLVPKSFQAPSALLEVHILHVLGPSSMFAVVVPTRLYMFRLFPFISVCFRLFPFQDLSAIGISLQ